MRVFVDADEIDITIFVVFTIITNTLVVVEMVGIVQQSTVMIPNISSMNLNSVANFYWDPICSQ